MAADGTLKVIALVSGGKDSFFSILHCLANGHQVVALANLYPPPPPPPLPASSGGPAEYATGRDSSRDTSEEVEDEADLNSFMYQTVGHQVIPLYAQATGLPLFRHPIVGTAVDHGLNYQAPPPSAQKEHSEEERRQEQPKTSSAAAAAEEEEHRKEEDGGSPPPSEEVPEELVEEDEDETESLIPLLRAVLAAHPEANALCTGAILSTYQRTRVESVALRLGLAPLSYLWQFPALPLGRGGNGANDATGKAGARTGQALPLLPPGGEAVSSNNSNSGIGIGISSSSSGSGNRPAAAAAAAAAADDAQLLRDMAAAGLDARIVKVASAGLDESFLWENVASEAGARRVARGMRRFGGDSGGGGGSRGSVLGEGGEFETLVVDGPPALFRGGRIVVREDARRVVREGGGSVWLSIRDATVEKREMKEGDDDDGGGGDGGDNRYSSSRNAEAAKDVRIPGLLDPRFEATLEALVPGGGEGGKGQRQLVGHEVAPPLDDLFAAAEPLLLLGHAVAAAAAASPSLVEPWCFVGSGHEGDEEGESIEAQTTRVVADIRQRLRDRALSATAITSAFIALRHMADFPAVNARYGALFAEPNPPARVTVACGDALPAGCAIAVYLTVYAAAPNSSSSRRGLHVQSRSYWAPANIGPYSQAISVPSLIIPPTITTTADATSNLAVAIAGQIPLVPASMALPSTAGGGGGGDRDHHEEEEGLWLQATLALQHLWRVAAATDVQWWTSAVAYLPRTAAAAAATAANEDNTQRDAALTAAAAWYAAHLWDPVDDGATNKDKGGGPDLWDRRFNSAYQTFGGEEADSRTLGVPDWEVVRGFDDLDNDDDYDDFDDDDEDGSNQRKREERREARRQWRRVRVPFFFAAEVDELPRQAGIEWHAHLGLAKLRPGAVRMHSSPRTSCAVGGLFFELHHAVVETAEGVFIQSAVAAYHEDRDQDQGQDDGAAAAAGLLDLEVALHGAQQEVVRALKEAVATAETPNHDAARAAAAISLQLVYTEAGAFSVPAPTGASLLRPVVPCYALRDARGGRLAFVALFQSRFLHLSSER